MSSSRGDQPGLRERKKARTRAAIQDHALRLFIEQGYENTTVEQIAAAAEVSQSTFFRYFPTKEDTIAYDRLDPIAMRAFLDQPPDLPPITALRTALRQMRASLRAEESELESARQRLIMTVPELRMRLMDQITAGMDLLNHAVAERTGRSPGDPAVRTWSGVVVGVVLAAFLETSDEPGRFIQAFDEGLARLEAGLPL
ncbi:MAG TPA: TetR family transcriptional regulator [Amycolatopsis sp.]|uniref:acyl-CoA-like ligand-binding transcription factor n=1 Tax=Amycolatopsis sp. TaxID=37632 RepID=UPI002B49807D|nr:TetR family transcriptional regulator [Amycolatopsis sp.]HKS45381.1 TetR family transcriptional regulator [Amycolatopsis sp.]